MLRNILENGLLVFIFEEACCKTLRMWLTQGNIITLTINFFYFPIPFRVFVQPLLRMTPLLYLAPYSRKLWKISINMVKGGWNFKSINHSCGKLKNASLKFSSAMLFFSSNNAKFWRFNLKGYFPPEIKKCTALMWLRTRAHPIFLGFPSVEMSISL